MKMKKYIKPKAFVVMTPATLMNGEGSGNLGIASKPYPGHGAAPTEAKQFNGMMDWDEEELSPEESTSPQSSWN